ncbi:MAG: hypothetical protein L6Q97_13125 [Thermoanaerobaculia bacterium]|nr:hypothetical protein [Thermoanaerobaculia bacterium]
MMRRQNYESPDQVKKQLRILSLRPFVPVATGKEKSALENPEALYQVREARLELA